jgi:gliding motility-associated-like protein
MAKFTALFLALFLFGHLAFSQDECNTAVNLPVELYSTCGEMAFETIDLGAATPSTTAPDPGCASFNSGTTNDLWYSFTVPGGVNTMAFHVFNSDNTIPFPNASTPGMAIYSGADCNNLTLLDCFESSGGFMANGEIRWEEYSGLTPGETVWMRVWDENNLAQNIFIAASVRLDLQEDDCDTPIELGTGGCNILSTGGDIQAPETCGWNTTDNSIFYHFTVTDTDVQPYTITAENGDCVSNEGGWGEDPEIQFAVYSWNGTNCDGIGGSPSSDPPVNNGAYYGCANGTGTVTFSENLPPGDYILAMDGYSMMSGNSLCTYGFSAPFIEQALLVDLTTSDAICGEAGSASIDILQSCTGNPTFNWSTGDSGSSLSGLTAGAYSVTVSDGAACSDTVINFNIIDDGNLTVDITTSGNACAGPFSATANVSGADPADCTFSWNTTPVQTTQTASDLTQGNYTVTVDFGTCQDTESVQIDYSEVEFTVDYEPELCAGEDAVASVNVTSGSAPFNYGWSTGDNTDAITINSSGNYAVTVLDDFGCTASELFNVTVHPAMNLDATITDNLCYGDIIGEIDVTINGGTAPYTYQWNTGDNTALLSNLEGGNYQLTVTDANGCSVNDAWNINSPDELQITFNADTAICQGDDVPLHIVASGGTSPLNYHWLEFPMQTASQLDVMPDVTTQYTVYVSDASGCESEQLTCLVTVSETMDLDLTTEDSRCFESCDGQAWANVTGGIAPFSYSWDYSGNYANGLCAGTYNLMVTDDIGCTVNQVYQIDEPAQMFHNMYTEAATCSYSQDGLAWVEVMGGTPPYQYFWSNGENNDSVVVGGGIHHVTVTDANMCVLELSADVDAPIPINVQGIHNSQICIGGEVNMSLSALGGTSPYDFHWTDNDGFNWYGDDVSLTPDTTTQYQVNVTDIVGCEAHFDFTVNVHPPLSLDVIYPDQDSICPGESIALYTGVSGGNGGPYQLFYNETQIIPSPATIFPQESGWVTVTASDACQTPNVTDSVYIHVWETPQNNFTSDIVGGCPPLKVHFNEINNQAGAQYEWNFGNDKFSFERNPVHIFQNSGLFTVSLKIIDENGCISLREKPNMIHVYPEPEIDFYTQPNEISMLNPTVEFVSTTQFTDSLYWHFGDGDSTEYSAHSIRHTYDGIGEFEIFLMGSNTFGCRDTAYKTITVRDFFSFYAPTAFTPNHDGHNDCFSVCGNGIDPNAFKMKIYNRWGELVFETETYMNDCGACGEGTWDGTYLGNVVKGDKLLKSGIYAWYVEFKDITGIDYRYDGVIYLVR